MHASLAYFTVSLIVNKDRWGLDWEGEEEEEEKWEGRVQYAGC